MARRRNRQNPEVGLPTLQMPRTEAEERLESRIVEGEKLLFSPITSEEELRSVRDEGKRWSDYNAELLRRIVDTDDLVNDYYPPAVIRSVPTSSASLPNRIGFFESEVRDKLNRLKSIQERLELIPESLEISQPTDHEQAQISDRVFIVHGHDEEAKQSVARCVERLGLEAVILHEQPDQGRTIIEKFEDYADVGFSVVLLTPDDVGTDRDDQANLRPRARQNVIFELGFFVGKLGRERVCALHKDEVETPSDISGVLWIPMDPTGAWRFTLGREMRAAGFDVDLNRLA